MLSFLLSIWSHQDQPKQSRKRKRPVTEMDGNIAESARTHQKLHDIKVHPVLWQEHQYHIENCETASFISQSVYNQITTTFSVDISPKQYNELLAANTLPDYVSILKMKSGALVAKYDVNLLGQGEWGKVYLGLDFKSNKLVAVKEQRDPRGSEKESNIMAKLDILIYANSDIASIYSPEPSDDKYYYVQPLSWGTPCEKHIQSFTVNNIFDFSSSVFNQTVDINKKGIIHKDLHSGNIMWDEDSNDFSIIDFGNSKIFYLEQETSQKECVLHSFHEQAYVMRVHFLDLLESTLNTEQLKEAFPDSTRERIQTIFSESRERLGQLYTLAEGDTSDFSSEDLNEKLDMKPYFTTQWLQLKLLCLTDVQNDPSETQDRLPTRLSYQYG
jgi:hypothetical protein